MLDWDKARDLQQDVGAEDFEEIVELFLDEVGEVVEKLRAMGDRADLGKDLHFLKGSASNLGFSKLSELCEIGEHLAEAGDAETVNVAEILEVYEQSKQGFLDGLETLRAA